MKKSKDWTGSKVSAFKMMGASNHCDKEREINDFYATDPKSIDMLLQHETFSNNIWECACGQGHLSERLRQYSYNVFATDIVNRGGVCDKIVDFLSFDEKEQFNGDIITNPPYKYCTEFILKALSLIPKGNKVATFLKIQTLEGQKRYDEIFSKYPPRTIYVFIKRIECAKNGIFINSSAVCYAWYVWEKGYKGDTIVKWI